MTGQDSRTADRPLSEQGIRTRLEAATNAAFAVDETGQIHYANEQAHRLFRYPPRALVDMGVGALVRSGRAETVVRSGQPRGAMPAPQRSGQGALPGRLRLDALRSDGSTFRAEVKLSSVVLRDGRRLCVASLRDVTEASSGSELTLPEHLRQRATESYRRSFELALSPMWITDAQSHYTQVNRALCMMLGRGPREILGRTFHDFTHPADLPKDRELVDAMLCDGSPSATHEKAYLRPDGSPVRAVSALVPTRDEDGEILDFHGHSHDVTERHATQERLLHQATHDDLTGLLNRRGFLAEVEQAAARYARHRYPAALMLLDADQFKYVNDTYGHAAGDEVLVAIADALRERLRSEDRAARLGGDEFAVLLDGVTARGAHIAAAAALAEIRASSPGFALEPKLKITISAGIYCFEQRFGLSAELALAAADKAMYRAKSLGGDQLSS